MDSGLAAAWRPGIQNHDATCPIFKQPHQFEGKHARPPPSGIFRAGIRARCATIS